MRKKTHPRTRIVIAAIFAIILLLPVLLGDSILSPTDTGKSSSARSADVPASVFVATSSRAAQKDTEEPFLAAAAAVATATPATIIVVASATPSLVPSPVPALSASFRVGATSSVLAGTSFVMMPGFGGGGEAMVGSSASVAVGVAGATAAGRDFDDETCPLVELNIPPRQ